MFCSKCGVSLPDDAIVCYKCAAPTNINFQNQPKQVQSVEQKPAPQVHKTVIVKNNSNIGSALVLLALLGGIGFYWYQQNKAHEYLGFKITDKGISVSSDGLKSSGQYSVTSTDLSSKNSPQADTQQITTQTTSVQPSYSDSSSNSNSSSGRCFLSNNGNSVNVREGCNDDRDCSNDPSSIYTSLPDGTEINVLDNQQSIPSGKGYNWLPIEYDGYIKYVASSKVYCQ